MAWGKLEKRHKKEYSSDFPECVKTLLISAGYDINSSLATLNEKKIEEIEEYLDSNRTEIQSLQCCYSGEYKRLAKFKFLPGHKAIILMIPSMIGSSKNLSMSDEDLKRSLVKKLMAAAAKAGLQLPHGTISEANLLRFQRTADDKDTFCKCTFSCPFCPKTYTIKYKTFWKTSNAWNHLKTVHIKNR